MILDFSDPHGITKSEPDLCGAEILDKVSKFIRRFVHLSDAQVRIVTIWCLHTHAIGAAFTTPYLNINSVTKQCGKSRLLEVLELIVSKPWFTGRTTAAALVRKIDSQRPCLLLDEGDAAFSGEKEYAEALRGILNSGHRHDGRASLCVGQGTNIVVKDFKTFSCKAIAGIGRLPDTIEDRSIPIRLQRKKPGETVGRFRRRNAKVEADQLKSQLSEWAGSVIEQLKEAEPILPDQLSDRQQDGIEPLLAIADLAGQQWPEAVRMAAIEIFRSQAAEDQNVGVQLLVDIFAVFQLIEDDKITSAELVEKLKDIETSPWAGWHYGKGLTPHGLGRLLKPFEIGPRTIKLPDGTTKKGYLAELFSDAWSRYLSASRSISDTQTVTPSPAAKNAPETHFSDRNPNLTVTVAKSASDPHKQRLVTPVTVQNLIDEGEEDTKAVRTMPNCAKCGSFALYRYTDGRLECQTCEAVS